MGKYFDALTFFFQRNKVLRVLRVFFVPFVESDHLFDATLRILGGDHTGEFPEEGGRGGKIKGDGGSLFAAEKSENSSTD